MINLQSRLQFYHSVNRDYKIRERTKTLTENVFNKNQKVFLYHIRGGKFLFFEAKNQTSTANSYDDKYSFYLKENGCEDPISLTLDEVRDRNTHTKNVARAYKTMTENLSKGRKYVTVKKAVKLIEKVVTIPENISFYSERKSGTVARELLSTLIDEGLLSEKNLDKIVMGNN